MNFHMGTLVVASASEGTSHSNKRGTESNPDHARLDPRFAGLLHHHAIPLSCPLDTSACDPSDKGGPLPVEWYSEPI
ncbi:unnamed protein product [Scytosiphon promiscuus]